MATRHATVASALLALALVGCGSPVEPPESAAPTQPAPQGTDPTDVDPGTAEAEGDGTAAGSTPSPTASPGGTGGTTGQQGPIEIIETSFDLRLADSPGSDGPLTVTVPSPGTYTFRARNSSDIPHALTVEGHGVQASTETIPAGQTAELQVELPAAGEYDLYCPVGNHEQLGMDGSVVVQTG